MTPSFLALACAVGRTEFVAAIEKPALCAQLESVMQRGILFAHQSVGMNVLEGAKQLASTCGVPIRIVEVRGAQRIEPATFGHMFVPENGKPLEKLRNFQRTLARQAAQLDVVMVKFCYVDVGVETDVNALFASYRTTIDHLRSEHPGTAFVHVTTPLTTVQRGIRGLLRRTLGHAPYGVLENMRREQYNALLRREYEGREPVFDLARIESTSSDGSMMRVPWKGSAVPALSPEYTDDGSHLNASGRLRAARELISVLAATPFPSQHQDLPKSREGEAYHLRKSQQ